jgi:hypothetical protein
MSSTITVVKMSNFDMCLGTWEPEVNSPAHIRKMSWRLGVPMDELVVILGVGDLVDMSLMTGGYEPQRPPKFHWNRIDSCVTVSNPKKSASTLKRIVSVAAFERIAPELRCGYCNRRFEQFKKP